MDKNERIKTALERNTKAVELRPSIGQVTATTRVKADGLRCEVEEGRWKIVADASEKSGGEGTGPDPGTLARAALGSCLAMGYVMWAAKLDVPISNVEVELQADFDVRGQYGLGDVSPGHTEVRYTVSVESSAPEADVVRVIGTADKNSMVLDVFASPQKLVRTINIAAPKG